MMRVASVPFLLSCLSTAQPSVWGPANPKEQPRWLQDLKSDRENTLKQVDYQGGVFDQVAWTQTAYMQPQMHTFDRFFYDPITHNYTVQRWLQDLKTRYGGIDAVLIWPTYPGIGIDDRNQFDYFRAMPGGLDGVKQVTKELHDSGVRVLWPYNPWDSGTRREPLSDADTFAELLEKTGGDGINGDTMYFVPKSFWDAGLQRDYPIAFEPEDGGTDQALNWETMGWGYWSYPRVPVVDRFKFLTHKFMTNVCDRWSHSKTDLLQMAWFNGDGIETWENVWGSWNGITPYDGEAIRRVATMLRFFGKDGYLQSPDWEPHTLDVVQEDVFASKWPMEEKNSTLWTLVNRGEKDITGVPQLMVVDDSKFFFDCYHGVELTSAPAPPPPPVPQGYNQFKFASCDGRNGGLEIDHNPIGNMSVAECTALCDGDQMCMCVLYDHTYGSCWRRADCQPVHFQFSDSSDHSVYLKKDGYSEYPEFECSLEECGGQLEDDQIGLGVAECQEECDNDPECSCVNYTPENGTCRKLRECKPSEFSRNNNTHVFLKEERRPAAPAPPPQKYLMFSMEAHGYGCVLETATPADGNLSSFLTTMQNLTQAALSSFDAEWQYLPQTLVDIPKTKLATRAPKGMVFVPNGTFNFITQGVEIEGADSDGVDVQFPWEQHPQRSHVKQMQIDAFYMDKYPVTATNYSVYLQESGYKPSDPYNWLKNWNGSTTPPSALADMPVTYVSLEEARSYCRWAHGGSRLPHVWEWQYAAQGTDRRVYPWGSEMNQSKYPKTQSGQIYLGPEPVTAHAPEGDSPFGVSDLVGNVWQYTDEFQDDHTRFVILKGGSNYRPTGSSWYFPQALELNTHEKYFLMDDRYERAGTLGFRCVVDASPDEIHDVFI